MHDATHAHADTTAAAPRRRAATSAAVLRARAVMALAASPAFRHASRRLVADLVERATLHRLGERRRVQARIALLVVVDGMVSVVPSVGVAARSREARASGATLGPGIYWRDVVVPGERDRLVTLAGDGGRARVLLLDEATLTRALRASPALAAVRALRRRVPPTALAEPRAHLVWVACAPGLALPLETAARLLAAAVGSQFAEPAAVVTAESGGARLAVWERDGFRTLRLPAAAAQREAVDALAAAAGRPPKLHHLFYVHPGDPLRRPLALAGQRFHRVVYLSATLPARIPHRLDELLEPALVAADGSGAHFSAFVPTVLVGKGCGGGGFRVHSVDGRRLRGRRARARRRLRRDLCRVALDARALATERWSALWQRHRATAERWARAVTNRRVGVALSGGGACAYRTLPLLRALDAAGIPLDVVSGVSGGALIGAYLSAGGVAGLARAERRGTRFLLAMLGAIAWSGCIEREIDRDLGGARVEDLETIFAAVTTELGDPPRARVVSAGTVGEAVRASAAAPVLFGPTRKDGRHYADGAAATMLPAAVLTGCGADLTLACTCVPPPTRGNPFARTLVGRLVYRWTPLGRVIDAWVATSMLLHTASLLAGRDAQVSWRPGGVRDPLGEALRFDRASAIVADAAARDGAAVARTVAELLALWRGLGA
ncbi:MAG TPA: patatin-like phospholipase family protein [Candidatus Binatia bacterium]